MIRLAVSPALIVLGAGVAAHLLAMNWVEWAACFEDVSHTAYRDYWNYLLSNWSMTALTLFTPFLAFIFVSLFLRESERLVWQWIGIGITTAFFALLLLGISSGTACPDEARISEYGLPELLLIGLGGGLGFGVCLIVTYIGSIRHARRSSV